MMGEFYEQVDGVAMGFPLSPVIAGFFMGAFEKQAIESAPLKPSLCRRYVDDTLVIWTYEKEALDSFVVHLNGFH